MLDKETLNKDWEYQNNLFSFETKIKDLKNLIHDQRINYGYSLNDQANQFKRDHAKILFASGRNKVVLTFATLENGQYEIKQQLIDSGNKVHNASFVQLDEINFKNFRAMLSNTNPSFEQEFKQDISQSQLLSSVTTSMLALRKQAIDYVSAVNFSKEDFAYTKNLDDLQRNDIFDNINVAVKKTKDSKQLCESPVFMFCDPEACKNVIASEKPLIKLDLSLSRIDANVFTKDTRSLLSDYADARNLDGKRDLEIFHIKDPEHQNDYYLARETVSTFGEQQSFFSRFNSLEALELFARPAIGRRSESLLPAFDQALTALKQTEIADLDLISRFKYKLGKANLDLYIEQPKQIQQQTSTVDNSVDINLIPRSSVDIPKVLDLSESLGKASLDKIEPNSLPAVNDDEQLVVDLPAPPASDLEQSVKVQEASAYTFAEDGVVSFKPHSNILDQPRVAEPSVICEDLGQDPQLMILFKQNNFQELTSLKRDNFNPNQPKHSFFRVDKTFFEDKKELFFSKAVNIFSTIKKAVENVQMSDDDKQKFLGITPDEYKEIRSLSQASVQPTAQKKAQTI